MKRIKKTALLFTSLLLMVSCNTDDGVEGIVPPNFDVLGLWDLVEVNVSVGQDLNMDGTASTNLMDELDCLSGTLLIDGDLVWTYEQSNIAITTITSNQFNADCTGTTSATGTWFSDETQVTFDGDDALTVLRISGDQLVNEVGEDLPGVQSFVYVLRVF
ncbi:hypothetical protein [Flagellimonas aquimarina]|nr:hypothetical protein [Allomuricauda koreensis]